MKKEWIFALVAIGALALLSSSKPTAKASLDDRVKYALENGTIEDLQALAKEAALAGRNDLVLILAKREADLVSKGAQA